MAETPRIAFLPGAAGERALVARLLAGEELAFRECYELHAPRTMRILLRMLGDRARAEDLLQDTFASAFAHITSFRGDAQLGTWITGIAIRRALNHRRDAARRPPAATVDSFEPEARELGEEEGFVVRRDLARHVLQLMEGFDPARRAALLLYAEGYTAAEIAEMTGAPRSTVLSQIARGRATLLERLGENADAAVAVAVDSDGREAPASRGKGRSRG